MYKLGSQFEFDYSKSMANSNNIIQGNKYRFTVLSQGLIRLEYNENGIFEDRPTSFAWYRNMPFVNYIKNETDSKIEIETDYFKLSYIKERFFSGTKLNPISNLKVSLKGTDKIWYYGHPEVRNYGYPSSSIDDNDDKVVMKKGLYSTDGFATYDDSDSYIIDKNGMFIPRENKTIDIYLFMYLNNYQMCLTDYFSITGYPTLIPRYALGTWWSKNTNYTDDNIKSLVEDFDNNEIPLSVILLDNYWHTRNYEGKELESGFSFNNKNYTNPINLIAYLHSKGIHLGLSINPVEGIYPYEKRYEEVKKYLIPDERGVIPFNVLDPLCLDVYFKILISPLNSVGVDFYWLTTRGYNNLYLLKHYQFLNQYQYIKNRPLMVSRNSDLCEHRYPVLYTGKSIVSWDTLKKYVFYNLTSANIGGPFYAHDIGGTYKGTENNELYIRFVQLGVFSPIFKFGSEIGKYYHRQPWKWSFKTYKICKDYINLRYRLIPYLYSEAYKYHKYGKLMIEPVYYKYSRYYDDDNYRNEYYFCSDFFVAPIVSQKDYLMNRVVHKLFLPDGVWYDFKSGKKFIGDNKYILFYREEEYPYFVREGAIIPLNNLKQQDGYSNNTNCPKNMEIKVFPGRSNSYKLYEDDGISEYYKQGYYIVTGMEYEYSKNSYTFTIKPIEGRTGIIPEYRNYRICFKNMKEPELINVFINGSLVSASSYEKNNSFYVDVDNVSTLQELKILCMGSSMEVEGEMLVTNDVESVISDLAIPTELKDKIDKVMFSDESNSRKRILVKKLKSSGLDSKFINLLLRLLEYLDQVD